MLRPIFIVATVVIVLALCSCSSSPASSPETKPPSLLTSPLTSPLQIAPTRQVGTGIVRGVLLTKGTPDKPVAGVLLYLANTVADDSGKERAVAVDRSRSPRATTGVDGSFTFFNVPPGRYGLVLDRTTSSYMLNKPDTGGDLLVNVEADGQVDLGRLVYNSLPVN